MEGATTNADVFSHWSPTDCWLKYSGSMGKPQSERFVPQLDFQEWSKSTNSPAYSICWQKDLGAGIDDHKPKYVPVYPSEVAIFVQEGEKVNVLCKTANNRWRNTPVSTRFDLLLLY